MVGRAHAPPPQNHLNYPSLHPHTQATASAYAEAFAVIGNCAKGGGAAAGGTSGASTNGGGGGVAPSSSAPAGAPAAAPRAPAPAAACIGILAQQCCASRPDVCFNGLLRKAGDGTYVSSGGAVVCACV